MGLAHSPRIVTNGLIFYYDMGNPQKSWKGKPTTNFISSLGDPTAEYARGEFGQYFNFVSVFETNGLVPYSLSFDAKGNIPGNMLVYMQNSSYTKYSFVSQNVTLSTDWQRFTFQNLTPAGPTASWTANTPNDNRAMLATFTTYGSGRNPVLRNFQLELGSFATPFVNGTRSNTQAILDLTNNNTVTATSLTYASNNTFSFNGVDNSITISNGISYASGFTLAAWIYPQSIGGGTFGRIFDKTPALGTTSGFAFYLSGTNQLNFSINGGTTLTTASSTISLNNWQYVVATVTSAGVAVIYINTVSRASGTTGATSGITTTNLLTVGNRSGATDRTFDGDIDVASVYNRALTAQEVQQNFLATKGRYGL